MVLVGDLAMMRARAAPRWPSISPRCRCSPTRGSWASPCSARSCEFFADKIAWLDRIWACVHTLVRPLGGSLIALALVDPGDPATQAVAFLLGGGGALLAHAGRPARGAVVNTSPEPVSNVGVSSDRGRRHGRPAMAGLRAALSPPPRQRRLRCWR